MSFKKQYRVCPALLLESYKYYDTEWDEPELQIEELDKVNELLLSFGM